MEFTTYWSILDTPSNSIKSNMIGLSIMVIGLILWLLTKKLKKENANGEKMIVLFGTATFSLLGLFLFVLTTFIYKDNTEERINKMLNSSKTSKVEGIISNFERSYRTHRAGKETTESFKVDSIKFAYSDAAMAKFNSFGQTYNNFLFNGQYVRVTFGNDITFKVEYHKILKIEILKTKIK